MTYNVKMRVFFIYIGLFLLGSTFSSVKAQSVKAQKVALNDIPLPWYSQKISGCPYVHCSLASSLMVYDYFKGMTSDRLPFGK